VGKKGGSGHLPCPGPVCRAQSGGLIFSVKNYRPKPAKKMSQKNRDKKKNAMQTVKEILEIE